MVMEGESLETVYQFDYLGCHFTSDGEDAPDMRHRMAIEDDRSRSARPHVARQPLTAVSEAAPLRSERLLDLNARQRGVDANVKSAGNDKRFQLSTTAPHHREVISGGCHQAFLRPADGCADA